MAPHNTKFQPEWTHKFSFIVGVSSNPHKARCTICKKEFLVNHGGITDVKQHIRTDLHKSNARTNDLAKLNPKSNILFYTKSGKLKFMSIYRNITIRLLDLSKSLDL